MENQEKSEEVSLAIIFEKLKNIELFIQNADKKYASKLSEVIVYGLVGIILIAFATAIVSGVVKAMEIIIEYAK